MVTWATPSRAAEYRPLPVVAPVGITADWLIFDASRNSLILYLPGYHAPAQAYYQWVNLTPSQPLRVSFAAQKTLSLFLDNSLIFTAPHSGNYTIDLSRYLPRTANAGQHLLCVWHPDVSPNYTSFTNERLPVAKAPGPKVGRSPVWQPQAKSLATQGQNVFLCFLLLVGLMYGGIRTAYQPGFARIYELWSSAPGEQNFLTRPTITWLNLLLVLVFSLSFALLLAAIHTNVQNVIILRRLFVVPESDLLIRVLVYTLLVGASYWCAFYSCC
ncbi:hypothetical protein [Hymenobacter busanensis]|uniref:hypothetical protein n=1 Tax=Hymenobacter busanensis TaxID=2607656 RepID=UPI001366DCB1|nr:hypothetical protein [Hymenobacter busanensis]QHJ08614.1 hypothetical protein GUY19_15480 [Hymenobacter busanensis]